MVSRSSRHVLTTLLLVTYGMSAWPAQAQYFRFGKNKVQYTAEDWSYLESKHFNIYYYAGGEELANFTATAAEEAYAQISDLFQHEISARIPIIVYQSHNDFVVTNAVNLPTYSEGIGGVTELFKNRIALPFTGDYRDYRRVVHHELVHAVINDMFYGGTLQSLLQNNLQLNIPHWFNEGIAEYAAEGWSSDADNWVRDAVINDNLADIPYLYGFASYQGGQGVWDYIAEQYGREKIADIMQRLRLTRSVKESFQRSTGLSLDELSERWQKALREIHYPEITAREDLLDIAKPLITREDGFYNTSPALSPQGDRLVYITTRNGLFDVYVADTNDGETIRKVVGSQTSPEFESLRILTPGITWNPDGTHIALAVKSGPRDAIAVVDVETTESTHYLIPEVDQILSVAWSPEGDRIAFSASMDAQSDIYVLDLTTHETTNYTNDLFSDLEPAWSPDGQRLVFHSDRAAYTELGHYRTGTFRMVEHDYSQFELYQLALGETRLQRLTFNETWDDQSAKFAPTGDKVLFISDRNGAYNLYEKDLISGLVRPLTDLAVGITQVSLSQDGQKSAVVSLKEGTPTIYMLKNPFDRVLDRETLTPTVWAQRVMQETVVPAPAIALAQQSRRQSNPFMRDATDGISYPRAADSEGLLLASSTSSLADFIASANRRFNEGRITASGDESETDADTTAYSDGIVRVDFRNYVFGEGFDEAAEEDDELDAFLNPFEPKDNLNEDGSYKPRKYKLTFSPDLIYGTAGYDALYGVQSVTQMMFSDMLGNHQIFVATNLLVDLRNSDYVFAYNYLPKRVDWGISGFHLSRLLPDFNRATYYRYRQYGGRFTASYPLDKFRRFDLDLSIVGVSQADITNAEVLPVSRTLFTPSITYTKDVTIPGMLAPSGGRRFAISLSGSPLSFDDKNVRFLTVLGDARTYTSFGRGLYSFAVRLSSGASFGPTQQLFYTAGVQNWLNRNIDDVNGFPIDEVSDFIFATPILPLRGYEINALNGSYFSLVNAEFRFPLVAALLPGPLPIFPLYNLQGSLFTDVGGVWGGRGLDNPFNAFRKNEQGQRVFDDMLVGMGFGLRTILLGYPVRVDFAWPHDGQSFGNREVYLSIGLDF